MYQIWYVPDFPLAEVNTSDKVDRSGREEWRESLAEDIRKNGLANPLIILNHRPPDRFRGNWLMTGTNRLWALRSLGWEYAPAIVTGECPYRSATPLQPDELQHFFSDGEVYFGTHGPRLRNVCKPEEFDYPEPGETGLRYRKIPGWVDQAEAG